MKKNKLNFEGIVFDLETQDMKQDDSYPLMSIAVTWDKKQGFRTWEEKDVKKLVRYIFKFPYVVGANLMGFDYQVLENYVPKVRSSLGRKTIDILTHARWGSVVQEIEDIFNTLAFEFGDPESKSEWHSYIDRLKRGIMFYGLTLDKKYRIIPNKKYKFRRQRVFGVSLPNLAFSTLQKKKKGKSASAPELYRLGKYKELTSYCKGDVLLTRDIFIYGISNGFVKNKGFAYKLPVWWREVASYLVSVPVKGKGSISEANNFAWQINHVKSSVSRNLRVSAYISDWKSVVQMVVSSYNPMGSYSFPNAKEKAQIRELEDEGVLD